jgi:hypothetical protein
VIFWLEIFNLLVVFRLWFSPIHVLFNFLEGFGKMSLIRKWVGKHTLILQNNGLSLLSDLWNDYFHCLSEHWVLSAQLHSYCVNRSRDSLASTSSLETTELKGTYQTDKSCSIWASIREWYECISLRIWKDNLVFPNFCSVLSFSKWGHQLSL